MDSISRALLANEVPFSHKRGGATQLIPAHFNDEELRQLDELQGGPTFSKKYKGIREYKKLSEILDRPEVQHAILKDHFARGGSVGENVPLKQLSGYGRYGDTKMALISPKMAHLFDQAIGGPSINPYTGKREYFLGGLFNALKGIAGPILGGIKNIAGPVINGIKGIFGGGGAGKILKDVGQQVLPQVIQGGANAINAAANGGDWRGALKEGAGNIVNAAGQGLQNSSQLPEWMRQMGGNLGQTGQAAIQGGDWQQGLRQTGSNLLERGMDQAQQSGMNPMMQQAAMGAMNMGNQYLQGGDWRGAGVQGFGNTINAGLGQMQQGGMPSYMGPMASQLGQTAYNMASEANQGGDWRGAMRGGLGRSMGAGMYGAMQGMGMPMFSQMMGGMPSPYQPISYRMPYNPYGPGMMYG